MKETGILYEFENWFSIRLPENWEYNSEEDIINVYSKKNPQGALQISLFNRSADNATLRDTAMNNLNSFITKFNIDLDKNTIKSIQTDKFVIANASGICEDRFIKVWFLVNQIKMLLVTYNSKKKNRELSTAENIVYSIDFI
jgi:hypothetical protein